jgi:8-hydroxy-5-deazaflavin:NADPH oxidoreductase
MGYGWPMRIAIIGPGKLGTALARLWSRRGHDVYLTFSRDPEKLEGIARSLGERVHAAPDLKRAVSRAEVVVLATKWAVVPEAVAQAGSLAGKLVLDCTNTMSPRKTAEGHAELRSCAEVLAQLAPGALVVKTLNQAFVEVLNADSRLFEGKQPTMFLAGDDQAAKERAAQLVHETGFQPVDAGPLENARLLEAYAVLIIRLGHTLGLGTNIAMRLMRR